MALITNRSALIRNFSFASSILVNFFEKKEDKDILEVASDMQKSIRGVRSNVRNKPKRVKK